MANAKFNNNPKKTCLHRFLNNCKNCTEDYDPNHHPNNLDCQRYREILVCLFTIENSRKIEKCIDKRN